MRAMRINTKKKECVNAPVGSFTMFSHCVYGYNIRNELVSATKNSEYTEYQYQYDDIGNRLTSLDLGTNRTYTANNLNQYTSISNSAASALSAGEFIPHFDDDMRPRQRRRVARRSEATEPRSGRKRPRNQTLIKTATGIWQVTYNGENRPIIWENVSTNSLTPNSSTPSLISMSYDRMGRRVTKNNRRFVYDGYLCIGKIEDSTSIHYSLSPIHCFVWDPTEPVATRPLAWLVLRSLGEGGYYTHDGNKNVSEVIAADGALSAHYEYAPFGAVVAQRSASAAVNPWRFSSEYAEDDTATVYYNYRNYEPMIGRWLSRDFVERNEQRFNMYMFVLNQTTKYIDEIGLTVVVDANSFPGAMQTLKGQWVRAFDDGITNLTIRLIRQSRQDFDKIVMEAVKAICYKKMEDEYCFERLLGEQHFDTSFQSKWDRYVLVEGEKDVYRGNELNYVGIGLYDAARGAPRSSLLIYIWKRIKYNEKPSKGALYWYYKGYDMLKEKLELLDPCTCEEKR